MQSGSKHGPTGEIVCINKNKVCMYNICMCWEFISIPPQTYHKILHEHEGVAGKNTNCECLRTVRISKTY